MRSILVVIIIIIIIITITITIIMPGHSLRVRANLRVLPDCYYIIITLIYCYIYIVIFICLCLYIYIVIFIHVYVYIYIYMSTIYIYMHIRGLDPYMYLTIMQNLVIKQANHGFGQRPKCGMGAMHDQTWMDEHCQSTD